MEKTGDSAPVTQTENRDRILLQIGHCLHQGCVICIWHAAQLKPHFTHWEPWGSTDYYRGDPEQVYGELDQCRQCHVDHFIRLDIEDYRVHSRFSFMVHEPVDRH